MITNICTRRGEEVADETCRQCFLFDAHLRTAFNSRRMRCVETNIVSIHSERPPTPHLDAAVQRLSDAGYSEKEIIKIAKGLLILLNEPPAIGSQTVTSPNITV